MTPLNDLPDWVAKPLIAGLVLGILAVGAGLFKWMVKPKVGEVTGAPVMFGLGILCFVWVAVMLPLGLFASDLAAPGQLAPWLAIMIVPAMVGALLVWSQIGVLARFDQNGVTFRRLAGRIEHVPWRNIRRVRDGGAMWSGAVFELEQGRPFLLSSSSKGAEALMLAAYEANVAGIEQFIPVPPAF